MNVNSSVNSVGYLVLNWTARVGSLVSFLVIGMFAFGGEESMVFASAREITGFVLFPVGVLFGMLLGWKWPLGGGVFSLMSLALFYAWHWSESGSLPMGPWFLVFSLPLFFFLAAGIWKPKIQPDQP